MRPRLRQALIDQASLTFALCAQLGGVTRREPTSDEGPTGALAGVRSHRESASKFACTAHAYTVGADRLRIRARARIGDVQHEFRQLGFPYPPIPDRRAAPEETLSIMPSLLRGDVVTLHGTHVQIDAAQIRTGAAQQPRVPILVAGGGEKSRFDKSHSMRTQQTSVRATRSAACGRSLM